MDPEKKNKVQDIMETISKLKWNWAGHVLRRIDYCWTTCIMFWMSWKHTRNRGRPRIKWRDDLDSFIKRCHCVTQRGRFTSNNGDSTAETWNWGQKKTWLMLWSVLRLGYSYSIYLLKTLYMSLTSQLWTYRLPVMGVILHNVAATMAKNITHDTKVFSIFLSYCNLP